MVSTQTLSLANLRLYLAFQGNKTVSTQTLSLANRAIGELESNGILV